MTCQKCEFFFLNKYCLTNYFDNILQHINIVLYDKRENDINGWLVGCLRFNGHFRKYFSFYLALKIIAFSYL